jgi:hypothetical protein
MNITFDDLWDQPANNVAVYGDNRRCSKRELYVIASKITTGNVWCDPTQFQSVDDFIVSDLPTQEVRIMKGIHPDSVAFKFGLHITLKVMSGCRSGNTFHAYGEIKGHAWEPDFVMMYIPGRKFWPKHKVSNAAVNNTIVIPAGVMPAATPGSPASMA